MRIMLKPLISFSSARQRRRLKVVSGRTHMWKWELLFSLSLQYIHATRINLWSLIICYKVGWKWIHNKFRFWYYILLICCTIINFCLVWVPLGFVLSIKLQQGQWLPSQYMKTLHTEHLFCPTWYLPVSIGLSALYLVQVPLHVIIQNTKYPIYESWKNH